MKRELPAIASLYTLLTLFMTYPLVLNLRTHVPGWGVDIWHYHWLMWYVKLAFLDPEKSLFYTDYIFYPHGSFFIPMSVYNLVLSVPLQYVASLSGAYNLLFLLNFVFASTTAFYLVRYLTGDSYAAFVSGVIFAFAPNTFGHAFGGHLGLITTGWIPLYTLFLLKLSEAQSFRDEIKFSLLAGIGLAMVAASHFVYLMFTAIFTGILLAYWAVVKKSPSYLISRRFLLFYSFSLFTVLPITYPLIITALSDENFLKPAFTESVKHSADLLSFFLPSVFHPIFGSLTAPLFNRFTGSVAETTTFTGYTVLALTAYAFKLKGEHLRLWKTTFLLTFLLTLGPLLHVMGETMINSRPIYLPYYVLYYIVPFLQNARTPARFDVFVMLSAAVLAGYTIKKLRTNRKTWLPVFITALILFEFLPAPYPLSKPDMPAFYKEIKDEGEYAIAEIPAVSVYGYATKAMYYQTTHHKKITGGALERPPPEVYTFTLTTPLLYELFSHKSHLGRDIFAQNETKRAQAILNYYKIRYVILNIDWISSENLTKAINVLNEAGAEKIVQTENQIVYRIPKIKPTFFTKANTGWHATEYWNNGTPTRWITGNATLLIYTPEAQVVNLSFTTASYHNPKTMQIFLNGRMVAEEHIPTAPVNITVPLRLQKGENILRLYTPDPVYSPYELGRSQDARKLAFYVQRLEIKNRVNL
jgi:hypothetical protein